MMHLNRREFLGLSAGFALFPLAAAAESDAGKRLVVIMLRGAVDGLNVVVPYREDAYYEARPTIAIGRPKTPDGALALDADFALHPSLAGLMPLWQQQQLAFIHAAGSPDRTRSHFDAQLYIENGTPGRRATEAGWMNRLAAALPTLPGGPHKPTEAVAVGPTLPKILQGRMAASNLPLGRAAAQRLPIDQPNLARAFDRLYAGDDPISQAYREGREARADFMARLASEEAVSEHMMMADNGAPPPNSFAAQAIQLSGLMARDPRMRLVFASVGGWDTHVRQGGHDGLLARRLGLLGDGLVALSRGIGPSWNDTVIVVISEFGRTVRENGNGGTDHGHGNAIWVMGGPVRGGRIYGEWPGLGAKQLHEGRDLAITTDYRTVLAAVMQRHLRVADRALDQVFPGLPPATTDFATML
jgi:uncharacterized protein (DUF1501 family)